MSHNQNHDYYNVKIRFRFFRFLSICKIVFLHFMRLLLSGDIHLNPGPFSHIRESDMLIEIVTKDCKNLNICVFNARSLKNKYDFFTDFLTNLTQNTIVVLTETWLNETDIYPENVFESETQILFKIEVIKDRSKQGWGVAIWVPRDISSKQRNDLNVLNGSFFEPLWVEISGLSVRKILINASYCPNKNLGNYFIDELTSETSSAYSITDEVLLFGDYNLNYFNKRVSTLLDEFASNSGLTLSITEKPTRATSQGVTLIDHGFSSKNQIQDVQIFSPSVEMDHLIVLYTTDFPVELKNRKQSFISRNKRKFDANKFSLNLSNQDWRNLYQCEDGNSMYNAFINVFSTTLEFHAALIKSFQPERKIAEKPWLTRVERRNRQKT